MTGTNVISKVFWPAHLCTSRTRSGFIIGWNVRSFTACVATIVSDVELADLEIALSNFSTNSHSAFAQMSKVCAVPPIVLGVFTSRVKNHNGGWKTNRNALVPDIFSSEGMYVREREQSANFWVVIKMTENYMPSLRSIYCCGSIPYTNVSSEIIFYRQPNPIHLQYLSLEPLVLDISLDAVHPNQSVSLGGNANPSTAAMTGFSTHRNNPKPTMASVPLMNERDATTLRNMQRIVSHSKIMSPACDREAINDMDVLLNQINTAYYLDKGVNSLLRKTRRLRRHDDGHLPVLDAISDAFVTLIFRLYQILFLTPARLLCRPLLGPAVVYPVMLTLFMVRLVAEGALFLLNLRFPKWILNGVTLKDLSTAAQQVDLRLQQVCFWPWQYMLLRRRNWTNIAANKARYISFYNSMWLVANDIIIGVAVGSFLLNNSDYLASKLHEYLNHYTVHSMESMLRWLMDWPAGLKLNRELGMLFGNLFLWLIQLWTEFGCNTEIPLCNLTKNSPKIILYLVCIASIEPLTPTVIGLIGLSGMCGASMTFSLLSDLLAFMTLHIYWFYMVAARIFNWQLTILYSLFNLFQGKKRNMLRNRIDSCDYDLDQLLLGTILFTLLIFLFPTIVVYYLTFATSRVGVIFLQALMETLLAFLNHFPLFAIMLRFKDPGRLPGGLRFEICDNDYFVILNNPALRFICWLRSWLLPSWATRKHSKEFLHQAISASQRPQSNRAEHLAEGDKMTTRLAGRDRAGIGWPGDPDHEPHVRRARALSRPTSWASSSLGNKVEGEWWASEIASSPLPGVRMANGGDAEKPTVCYLYMKNMPIPLSAIFFQYLLLWKRLSAHYLSLYVLRCLMYGEPIKPIPKLQYPMLPETRYVVMKYFPLFRLLYVLHLILAWHCRPTLMNFWLFLKVTFAMEDDSSFVLHYFYYIADNAVDTRKGLSKPTHLHHRLFHNVSVRNTFISEIMSRISHCILTLSLRRKMRCFPSPRKCPFCDVREGTNFKIMYEDEEFKAFVDRSPAGKLHLLVIPIEHIVERMIIIGTNLLHTNGFVPSNGQSRLGFHVPPFNSIDHLHLHVIGLPFRNFWLPLKYSRGKWWWAEAAQIVERLKGEDVLKMV
ncbi:hypothetical protein BC937DRAFT_91698 [Endogone sp. FLAS-F59071]|nr:hypothetical protein BC937DRAFT_91698 [Endogone sp. FLAS-F59071]|eukprot:RUS21726.1 hypothetical protein BC937DRAFT_91698 [Endogone sp. FLAS-F59071]